METEMSDAFEWNAHKLPEELWVTCDVCGVRGDPLDIEVLHRPCRMKAVFSSAYRESGELIHFDPVKMREAVEGRATANPEDRPNST